MSRTLATIVALTLFHFGIATIAEAAVVDLPASKDNSMYSEDGTLSNGAGEHAFIGQTKDGFNRRALIAFDIAAGIPGGATINSVSLDLNFSRTKNNTLRAAGLHRALVDWGEGNSLATQGGEGQGAPADTGDATWTHYDYPVSTWTSLGGDYDPTASGTTSVGGNGGYIWSSAQMATDIQNWLDTPATNFGWVLIGNETTVETAKRFDTRQNGNANNRPVLTVDYTPADGEPTGACCLSDSSCVVTTAGDCALQSGSYQGDEVPCTPDPCIGGALVLDLTPAKDNTIYSASGTVSNGAGQRVLAGSDSSGDLLRGVLAFDVAASLPANATVMDAVLTLTTVKGGGGAQAVAVHRLLGDWGEGTSDAGGQEDVGAAATTNDATWTDRFYPGTLWTTAGGDYDPTASATQSVVNAGPYAFSSANLVADIQGWINDPASEFGWIIVGNEAATSTVKYFASRHDATATNWPLLTITYSVAQPDPTGACCFNDASCDTLTMVDCEAQGGSYQGDGSACTANLCPLVLEPYVDALPLPGVATPVSGSPGAAASYEIAVTQLEQQLHRDLPPTTVWGYGGSYPGPTIEAWRNETVTVTWQNDLRDSQGNLRTDHYLPVDLCMHGPNMFGNTPRIVTHLHGAHVEAIYDGYPEDSILPGEQQVYVYANNQLPATLWYHDHALGITRLNVIMGMAGFYLLRDQTEVDLGLPSGEFEIPLAIQDRSFNPDGSFQYPAAWQDHFFGDFILVNGKVWPFLNVKQGKYRFRLLGGSTSRTYTLALSTGDPFTVIGTEGGLLPSPIVRNSVTITPGERFDVIVDFAAHAAGTEILLQNSAPAPFPGSPGQGVVAEVMKIVVQGTPGFTDPIPDPLRPFETLQEGESVESRDFVLRRESDPCAGSIWTINGLHWDDITERPVLGTTEIWRWINPTGITHPMHMHLVMFQVLDRQPFTMVGDVPTPTGPAVPPDPEDAGWKDTVPVYPDEMVRVIARFEDYSGLYPYHCHILEHEDHEMMRQFEAVEAVDADLALAKFVDDSTPDEGASILYTVELTNNGPDAAANVEITDLLPAGVSFVSAIATNGSYDAGTGVWDIGLIHDLHTDSLLITAAVDPGTAGATITNTATVILLDQTDPVPGNDTASVEINVPAVDSDLSVVKSADSASPNVGDTVRFTIAVNSAGPDPASGVAVTDSLPPGLTFVGATATTGSYDSVNGLWTIGSIAVSSPDTLEIEATVDPGMGGSTISNTAYVSASDQADPTPANDTSTVDLTVQSADLVLSKAVDDPTPNEGGSVQYEVVLTNNGPNAATAVQVTDLLPSGLSFLGATTSAGSYDQMTGIWDVGGVGVSVSDTLLIDVDVNLGTGGTTINNAATVTAVDQEDPTPADAAASVGIDVITVVGVSPVSVVALRAVQPNPFQATTFVHYDLPWSQPVRVVVYDVSGRRVRTMIDGPVDAGRHVETWNGQDSAGRPVASGVYFIRMDTRGYSATQKVVRIR
jgi:spore coat protein A